MRRAKTERPDDFTVDLGHPLAREAVLLGLGHAHHSPRYRDESANGRHGTLTSMDPLTDWVWVPALGRRALDFDGSNDNVALPSAMSFGTTYTISLWVKRTLTSALFLRALLDSQAGRIIFGWEGSSTPTDQLSWYDGSWRSFGFVGSLNVLYHIALTNAAGSVSLYVNGAPYGSTVAGTARSFGTATRLGSRYDGTNYWYGGFLADVLMHRRILAPAEIAALADPSNVMLSGLIVPPRRRLCVIGALAGGTTLTAPTVEAAATAAAPAVTLGARTITAPTVEAAASAAAPAVTLGAKTSQAPVAEAAAAAAAPAVTLGAKVVEAPTVEAAATAAAPAVTLGVRTITAPTVEAAATAKAPAVVGGATPEAGVIPRVRIQVRLVRRASRTFERRIQMSVRLTRRIEREVSL